MSENIIETKSYKFAIDIVNIYKELQSKNEYVLSKQLLRSGTSIGANVMEGLRGNSRKDFLFKMNIALKEANETEYWIRLLIDTGYLNKKDNYKLISDCKEICRILNSIVRTTKQNGVDRVEEQEEIYKFDWTLIE
ncbi:four helix bundle protein [Tissierella sp. Yu-01]|uniref:four helix bundle protein n=1 Tax=Tissierella sp. Yu-01 TaxID=3035694 RepID=UPI00240D0E0E|nr:four helix bundle protein [Tissierella sp. Yu-01]WFA08490.1 four helix bundle protein [Tissierella sp. Yu-01]